jgi:translation initiation factor IF-2
VIRNGKVLQDELTVHSMKKVKDDITSASKGTDIGLSFENFHHGPLEIEDIIECYKDIPEKKMKKFNRNPGIYF